MANSQFLAFIAAIVAGDADAVARLLAANPLLATMSYGGETARRDAPSVFYDGIAHYMYGGDTALHMAAAACRPAIAELLIARGASVRAKNRRGAEPLHYAADGDRSESAEQAAVIRCLISADAGPNAVDRSGVAPLHRAVRTRSPAAVRALIDGGANVNQPNRSGSTPLFLARHNTGSSGSGTPRSVAARAAIETFLIARGAAD